MSVTTVTKNWSEWKLYGAGYAWSTWYIANATITVTRNTGSDTATVQVDASMTSTSGDNSLGAWECVISINGASSGGGEKTFTIANAGLHIKNTAYTASQTFTVGVGVSAGTLTGTIKMHLAGYSGNQGEFSPSQEWSLTYDTKGTPSQATWSNYNWGKASTITIQRGVPDFRETVELVWQDDTSHPVSIRNYRDSSATTISYTIPYTSCPTNAKTRSAKIRVKTYNGDSQSATQIGTWETSAVTVTLLSGDTAYNPTISANPVCQAYNSDGVSALGTDTAVAQFSKLNVKADSANVYAKHGATIVSYVVTFSNGSTASGSQLNHISSVIQSAGTVNWTYKVTDSRGYTAERNGSYNVINSSAPSIPPENVTVYRGDSSGTAQEGGEYIYATATATCESLNGHNSVTLQGKVGSGSWQSMTNGTRKTLMSNADPNTQYVVTLKATDLLRSTEQTYILPSLDVPLDIPPNKHGMGIGMEAQASDNTLYVGYDAKFYGDIIKHDSVNNRDIDINETKRTLVGAWGTRIPVNANLNSDTYKEVGTYYCASNNDASTLTNSPTSNAFMLETFSPMVSTPDSNKNYRVQQLTDYTGEIYIRIFRTSSWESWYKVQTSLASESGNVAQWLKASVGRPSSLDFPHIYDGDKVHCRLDISSSALSGGVNSIFGEGYVLTFMWDNSGSWDTQFYLPDADGKEIGFRTHNHSTNQWSAVKRLCTNEIKLTTITSLQNGASPYSSSGYGGCFYEVSNNLLHLHLGVSGLTANTLKQIYTMPSGYRPATLANGMGYGSSFAIDHSCKVRVTTAGVVEIVSTDAYACADVWYYLW